MINQPLLSICVPTYNRASKLFLSLGNLLEYASAHKDIVQVIVSDNCSTDATADVVVSLKKEYPFLECYRNKENLGANRNFFSLSDKYAKGKYFWLLGDDDVLDPDAINQIVYTLQTNPTSVFLGLSFRVLTAEQIRQYIYPSKREVRVINSAMVEVVNLISRPENMLATFISCNIILLDRFRSFDKSIFSNHSWDNFQSVFPHTHIISSVVKPSEPALFISEPLMSVIVHEKEWSNNIATIHMFFIIKVYNQFIKCGYPKTKMRQSRDTIIKAGIPVLILSRAKLKYKAYYLRFALYRWAFYSTMFSKALKVITKK